MIPITVLDKKGAVIGQQAFNDNLTAQEQINRALLAVIFGVQQVLTNDKNDLDKGIMAGAYDDAKLEAIKTAAFTLDSEIKAAIKKFEEAVA